MSVLQSEPKRSEIDPTRFITKDYWTISLVRLPDASNDEHAFLVLEGIEGNTSMIWFADFVANDTFDSVLPGIRDGKVRTYHDESVGSCSKLLFTCPRQMMQIRSGRDCLRIHILYSTWQISKPTARMLIKNIEKQKEKPPKYNILGNSALAASSATSSRNRTGHNCFTFAREMLRDLNDEYINLPEDTLGRWIYSATSRFLVDRQFNNRWWKASRFFLMFTFLAGVAITYVCLKLL
jgi:hypothetical protein